MAGEPDLILKSAYKPIPIDYGTTAQNVVDLVLNKSKANIEIDRTNWLTNSISGHGITFDQIEPYSASIASSMIKRGMKKGDVALYLTSDVTDIYLVMIGVWRCGGVMYANYVEDTEEQLITRAKEAKVKWIFCDAAIVPKCKVVAGALGWNVEIIIVDRTSEEVSGCTLLKELFEDDRKSCPVKVETTLDDPVLILCTSGTTGLSKGAVYTNRSVLAFCLGTDSIPYVPKPALYLIKCTHVLGVLFPIRNIVGGVWAVMMSQILKTNVYKAVAEYKPFLIFGFPTYLIGLVNDPEAASLDKSCIELMATGGVVITPNIYETLLRGLPNLKAVINGYGMTECGAVTTTIDLNYSNTIRTIPNLPSTTVGLLYPNTELIIKDLTNGKCVGPNKIGEIVFKSPVAATSYYNQPEATLQGFQNGWIFSGDLGYYDENGFLFIVDRIKETFKYFNNHISPAELEDKLLQHPTVAEASVIGIIDPEGGDRIPRGFIVLKAEYLQAEENQKKKLVKEIQDFVDEKVASYKKLRGGLYIVDSLPKGKTGKVMRSLVAEIPIPQ